MEPGNRAQNCYLVRLVHLSSKMLDKDQKRKRSAEVMVVVVNSAGIRSAKCNWKLGFTEFGDCGTSGGGRAEFFVRR